MAKLKVKHPVVVAVDDGGDSFLQDVLCSGKSWLSAFYSILFYSILFYPIYPIGLDLILLYFSDTILEYSCPILYYDSLRDYLILIDVVMISYGILTDL